MSRIFMYIMALLMLASCGAARRLPIESEKDSVSVVIHERVIYKDSLIYVEVPAESESVIIPDSDTSRLETSLAKSEAWVSEGQLNHTLRHKPDVRLPKIVTLPIYLRSEEKAILNQKVLIKEVEKELNWWQSFRITIGTISLLLLGCWLIIKLLKRAVVL